jgi:membrane protease YdiL (CAAX protease family)
MFIEQGVNPENKFWKYLVGSVVIVLASTIGQIPLLVGFKYKELINGDSYSSNNEDIMHSLEPNVTLFLILISFVFALGGVYYVVRYLHNQTMLSVTTSRKKMDWSRFFFAFSLWAIFTVVSTLLFYFVSPDDFIINFKPIPFAILVIIGALLIPIQTSTEEYVFRGYLMQGFANLSKNRWFPLLMTSIIFGGMHLSNPEVLKWGILFLFII